MREAWSTPALAARRPVDAGGDGIHRRRMMSMISISMVSPTKFLA